MLGEGVGQVLDAMDSASPHQEAWVMVTSTAGPANPETSGWIRLDQLRVPLLVFDPGTQDDSQEVTEVVQLLDVMPTVIGRAGGSPVQGLTGRDLLDGPGPEHGVEIYAESGDGLALRSGRWLLTSRSLLDNTLPLDPRVTESLLEHPVSDATHYQLHDIEADPDQEKNLVETEAETAEALRAMLIEHRRNLARPAQEVLTPERLRVLREGQGEGQGEGHN